MKKNESQPRQASVPVILDTSLSFSSFFLVFLTVFVAGVSYLSGASPAQILMRTGVGILVMGLLLWGLNWQLASNMIQAAYADWQAGGMADSDEQAVEAESGEGQDTAKETQPK